MRDLVIHKGQLDSKFKSSSENHKTHAALLFNYSASKTPSHRSYGSPWAGINVGPKPLPCALVVFWEICRKGPGASTIMLMLEQSLGMIWGGPILSHRDPWVLQWAIVTVPVIDLPVRTSWLCLSKPWILWYQNCRHTAWSTVFFLKHDTGMC